MANFLITVRIPGNSTPQKENVSADNQSAARKKVEAMYKGCKIVSCVQK